MPKSIEAAGLPTACHAPGDTRFIADRLMRFRRDEDGGLILFSLFIFILMLLISGMAVDLMRFETRRTALQNTLDAASLAATNLSQERDSTELVQDFMDKRGYDSSLVNVTSVEGWSGDEASEDPGILVSRTVTASYRLDMNTFFMPLIGIESLGTQNSGAAHEAVQDVEISLVVDISGSMSGQKLTDLKTSAKSFVDSVVIDGQTEGVTSLSIIPYNHTVVVPDDLFAYLNTTQAVPINNPPSYTGAMTSYKYNHPRSRCVRWSDDDMMTDDLANNYEALRSVSPTELLDLMAYYDPDNKSAGSGGSYDEPAHTWNRRCDPTRTGILAYQTSRQPLKDHIDAMYASGWTAIDHGMKWGVALLDPAFREVVNAMVDADQLPEVVRDRPFDYDPANIMKVVVLMTDGVNTNQYDLKNDFKRGPSRIWFSEKASTAEDPDGAPGNDDWEDLYIVDRNKNGTADRDKQWYDGYYVLMPDNGNSARWMRPHKPWDTDDATGYYEGELPDDAVQMDYADLYERFSERALAELFRDYYIGDWDARNAHRYAETTVVNRTSANRRMNGYNEFEGICDAAKQNTDILVYTIAFGSGADTATMADCSSGEGYAFNASDGQELNEAFAAIASSITKLRLTQ